MDIRQFLSHASSLWLFLAGVPQFIRNMLVCVLLMRITGIFSTTFFNKPFSVIFVFLWVSGAVNDIKSNIYILTLGDIPEGANCLFNLI